MPRYEFDGTFMFANRTVEDQFGTAVQTFINNNAADFFGYTPINVHVDYHGTSARHVQARFTSRANLDKIFAAAKTQAQNRGAVAPSSMWLKVVADEGGVTEGLQSSAPAWTDSPVA